MILAVDIGTTGAKAALVGRDGALLGSGYAGYSTETRAGGIVEQQPGDWWRATCDALAELWQVAAPDAPRQVAAVVLSGQMQDLILLDEREGLGAAILYSDSRAGAQATRIAGQVGRETLEALTGNEQGAASVLAKWRWLVEHEPQRLKRATALLCGAHDYVAWRLSGVTGADVTTASTTGLLDLATNEWAHSLLQRVGLDPALLPPLRPSGATLGRVSQAAAAVTGIVAGTPLLQGVGDLGATTVGVGAGEPGPVYAYLGTSGWIASSIDVATPDPAGGIFTLRHPQPARFIQVAPMLTAGGNLDWLRGVFGSLSYADIEARAATAAPGSGGVLYLPYLAGERSPFSDPNARACFIGVSATTTDADLARAVLEGTAFAFRSLSDALGVMPDGPLLLAGGGAKSVLWSQILADLLQRPVHVVADPASAAARGAALIAGNVLGWYATLRPGDAFFPVAAKFQPDNDSGNLYTELYQQFCAAYPAMRGLFAGLAAARSQ